MAAACGESECCGGLVPVDSPGRPAPRRARATWSEPKPESASAWLRGRVKRGPRLRYTPPTATHSTLSCGRALSRLCSAGAACGLRSVSDSVIRIDVRVRGREGPKSVKAQCQRLLRRNRNSYSYGEARKARGDCCWSLAGAAGGCFGGPT